MYKLTSYSYKYPLKSAVINQSLRNKFVIYSTLGTNGMQTLSLVHTTDSIFCSYLNKEDGLSQSSASEYTYFIAISSYGYFLLTHFPLFLHVQCKEFVYYIFVYLCGTVLKHVFINKKLSLLPSSRASSLPLHVSRQDCILVDFVSRIQSDIRIACQQFCV